MTDNVMLAGALSGIVSCVCTYPLNTLQVVRQTSGRSSSVLGIVSSLYREAGISRFYRGLSPTLTALIPSYVVHFTCYERLKNFFSEKFGVARNDLRVCSIASASGSAITATLMNPLWVIKVKRQVISSQKFNSTFQTIKTIFHEEGVKGFYKGLIPSLWNTTYCALQFPLLEFFKQHFAKQYNMNVERLPPFYIALSAMLSSSCVGTFLFPLDLVRSRLQSTCSETRYQYNGMLNAFATIYKQEGFLALYQGIIPYLCRVVLASSICWTVYESTKMYLKERNSKLWRRERYFV